MKPKHIKKLLMSEIKKVASEPHKYCMNPFDGSDIQIPTNSADTESYIEGTNGHKGYNLLHINALYDLNKHIYSDVIIQKAKERNEHKAFQELVDCSEIAKALVKIYNVNAKIFQGFLYRVA